MHRLFRRQIRKSLAQNVPPILQEANFVFSKGEYGRAAELFEQLARTAEGRGGPRAPLFYLQAGRARLLAGQAALGIPSLQRGLELLAQRGQFQRLNQAGKRTVRELVEQGLNAEASAIEAWLGSVLPAGIPIEMSSVERGVLPTHCPACGAPLRPSDVEWLDERTAECGYCGSPVRENP
ncbi:MAG: hypothetical protein ACOYYF_02425 [Chloroflexota bacterium]|nr:hypothetical protein [Chloroflexota bacterium]MBI5703529.1 hypothetical protein [Chloroflexota bacterium]